MKRLFSILALLMAITFFASNQSFAAGDWNVNANLAMGAKALNKDDWEPLESHTEMGFNVDFGKKNGPSASISGCSLQQRRMISMGPMLKARQPN